MLRSLRGRLLLSYLAVIGAALVVIAAALFGFATVSGVRLIPSLQRLAAISRTNQNELLQLWALGASSAELQGLLINTAEQTGTRILVVDSAAQRIILDTTEGDDWVGDAFTEVQQLPGVVLPNVRRGSLFGRFVAPNGAFWLVFAEPDRELGDALIFYAEPEQTATAFFREFFLRPLTVAGLLALLLSVLLAAIISRSVAGPLRKMATAAQGIAGGDYEQRVPPAGPEEVQQVAASFNSMAAQVKSTQQAQRDFVANVSHDLKTPITAISGWSQAILDGAAAAPDERDRAAQTIYSEAGRMDRLVDELLELARLESGQMELAREPVDLAQLLEVIRRNFEPRAQSRAIDLLLHSEAAPPAVGDPDRLAQVFTNLVDNALTYTPAGGQVVLTVRPSAGGVAAGVRDNGPGIDPADQGRVFERFFRGEKSRARGAEQGSGLGLAIVRELVVAHGGQIAVVSTPGLGTEFTVWLPAMLAPTEAA